jgi:hypothetical protein
LFIPIFSFVFSLSFFFLSVRWNMKGNSNHATKYFLNYIVILYYLYIIYYIIIYYVYLYYYFILFFSYQISFFWSLSFYTCVVF